MHILAILFVLSALALAFGVIGVMLIAHRERIGEALGITVMATQGHELIAHRKFRTRRASVMLNRARPVAPTLGHPLAA